MVMKKNQLKLSHQNKIFELWLFHESICSAQAQEQVNSNNIFEIFLFSRIYLRIQVIFVIVYVQRYSEIAQYPGYNIRRLTISRFHSPEITNRYARNWYKHVLQQLPIYVDTLWPNSLIHKSQEVGETGRERGRGRGKGTHCLN